MEGRRSKTNNLIEQSDFDIDPYFAKKNDVMV